MLLNSISEEKLKIDWKKPVMVQAALDLRTAWLVDLPFFNQFCNISLHLIKCKLWNSKILKKLIALLNMYVPIWFFSALCYIWRAQSSPYFPWWQKEMLWILMTSKVTKSLNFAYTPCSNWLCKLLLPVETKKKNQFCKKSLNGIISLD